MGQQEKLENKMAICQAMDGQPPLRIERLAQLSGVSGRDLTDALVELEGGRCRCLHPQRRQDGLQPGICQASVGQKTYREK